MTAPTGRRSRPRTRSTKPQTNARASTAVLDLVDESSDVEPDGVIDLSPVVAPQKNETPAIEATPEPDARLCALGLPLDFMPSAAPTDMRAALQQSLSRLPVPPPLPRARGAVIAIVGIGSSPVAVARRLAEELRIDPENVELRSPETMRDIAHADGPAALDRSRRRPAAATIVACTIGPGRAQLRWAYRVLERLEPAITWAVVDASMKPEDVRHRIELLGGVDVIALAGIADTTSPAAILGLGVPVGRIGAAAATPELWADLLADRLARQVTS